MIFCLMLRIELEDLIMIFSLNVAFPWKIYSRLPLKTNNLSKILDIGLHSPIKLNRLTILSILI